MELERKSKKVLVQGKMEDGAIYVKIPSSIVEFLDLKGDEYFQARGKIEGVNKEKKIGLKVTDIEVE